MSKFVHNKSIANVSLINSKILIPIGSKLPITDQDAQHEDTIHALRLGWITIEGDTSKTSVPKSQAAITFAENPLLGSDTIPILPKKESTVTTTNIGASETPAKKSKKTDAE